MHTNIFCDSAVTELQINLVLSIVAFIHGTSGLSYIEPQVLVFQEKQRELEPHQ